MSASCLLADSAIRNPSALACAGGRCGTAARICVAAKTARQINANRTPNVTASRRDGGTLDINGTRAIAELIDIDVGFLKYGEKQV